MDYAPDHMEQAALDFIRSNRSSPFFLYYATTIPHYALQVPEDSLEEYKDAFGDTPYIDKRHLPHLYPRAALAAMITRADRSVGRIMELIQALDLDANTLVVVSSDNGPTGDIEYFNRTRGLKGAKTSVNEGGIRVPFLARWPGKIAPSTSSDHSAPAMESRNETRLVSRGARTIDGRRVSGELIAGHRNHSEIHRTYGAAMRRLVMLAFLLGGIGSLLPAAKPNIVFIVADDLGWSDLGCYGSTFHDTPHLDQLAGEGLRFTQAYAAGAVCSPTRSSIMTGRVPVRTGVTDFIPGFPSTGRKLQTPRTRRELALEEITVAESLKSGGYQTFYAGKWHLGRSGFEPDAQGFDVYASDEQLGDHRIDWQVGRKLSEAAVKFLDERDAARPFFMFLGFHEPHAPVLEYPDHIGKFRARAASLVATDVQWRAERIAKTRSVQNDPVYGSEVAGLDAFVGRVLARLDHQGLAGTTIVIFLSDNGGLSTKAEPGPTSNEPLRAGKGWLYEGGIRVPLIVRAPSLTKRGSTTNAPVFSTDFYPTLLELAGLPAQPEQHRDGVSIVPLLRGQVAAPRDAFFWHYPHYHDSGWTPGGAMREGDWKLIEFFEEGTAELYNLATDLSERANLAATEPVRLKTMRARLAAWRAETGAFIPRPYPESRSEGSRAIPRPSLFPRGSNG